MAIKKVNKKKNACVTISCVQDCAKCLYYHRGECPDAKKGMKYVQLSLFDFEGKKIDE